MAQVTSPESSEAPDALKKKFFRGDLGEAEIKAKLSAKLAAMFQYRSRMDQDFSDADSQDRDGDANPYNDFSGLRTGAKFLQGQREYLAE